MPVRGVALLGFFLLSLPVCFVRPFYGVVLWTIVAFLNPQKALLYWPAAANFPWAQAVAVPTLAGMLIFTRGWLGRMRSTLAMLLLVLYGWFTVTSIVSTNTPLFMHHAQDTWDHWQLMGKILLMTFVTVALTDNMERFRWLVLTMAGCFGYFVLKAVPFMVMTGGAFRVYGPQYSMIADNNDFGLAMNMTVPIFFFLSRTEQKPWLKRLFFFIFLGSIPAVFCTYSRGALFGLIVVALVMIMRMKQRLILLPVIAIGIGIPVLFAPEAWKDRMDPSRAVDASAKERLNAWAFARHLAMDYPVTGGGFDTFTPELFDRYAPNVLDVRGPHSVYFQVLAEHGVPGLVLYLSLLGYSLFTCSKLARQARSTGDTIIESYATMFQLSLIGFASSGIFLGRAYFDYVFTIFACIIILSKVARAAWEDGGADFELQTEEQDEQLLQGGVI